MNRKTEQRTAIRHAFEDAERPLNAQEVLQEAQKDVPGMGIATVYRSLKILSEEGWLRTVDLPGEPSRYEIATKGHHHHFHCRGCKRVFDIHSCPSDVESLIPSNFFVEEHEIILYGQCPDCREEAR